jgi:hypothetical protein
MRDGVFDPSDIARLDQAYRMALDAARDGFYGHIPEASLQALLARQIILAACKGERDPERLAEAALRSLRRPVLLNLAGLELEPARPRVSG